MLHIHMDGNIKSVLHSPFIAASEDPGITGVSTRDAVVDRENGVAARLFLPIGAVATGRRLPLVLFFHGGGYLAAESAFCLEYHRCATSLAACAGALVVSVEYRLAPEHPTTAAYDDAWTALRWAASFGDPWLMYHADPNCTFLAGDGAGGNIAYHTAVRASRAGNKEIDIEGLLLLHPFFWWGGGLEWLASEKAGHGGFLMSREQQRGTTKWRFVTVGSAGINYDFRWISPPVEDTAASHLCRRALVAVAEKGTLLDSRAAIVETRQCLHVCGLEHARTEKLMDSIVEFINGEPTVVLKECDRGSMLHHREKASSVAMGCVEVAPSMSNGPCQAVPAEVPRRNVAKSCL